MSKNSPSGLRFGDISKRQIFAYVLVICFAFLVPFQEWPDTYSHWNVSLKFYAKFLYDISDILGFQEIEFVHTKNFDFFSDQMVTVSEYRSYWINLLKLPFVILALAILNKAWAASIPHSGGLPFAPPFYFSLMAISLEPFAIVISVFGFVLMQRKKIILGCFLGLVASLVDRSMAPTFGGLLLLGLYILSLDFEKKNLFLELLI